MESAPLAIFLSPHFDDIALSCGGMAARLSRSGARCIGLTVFAAPAPEGEPLSDFAQLQHSQWESAGSASAKPINAVRRDEERAAMHLLGLEPVWLDLPDAPYRRASDGQHFYTSNEKLMSGTPALEERHLLVPRIAGEIARVARETGVRGRVRVFAPLAVGGHVDHLLVFLAARRLGPRYGVLYYEDYPYAAREGTLAARLDALHMPMQARITSISDLIGVKIAAIARYKSQLNGLFEPVDSMPSAVRSYAQSVGQSAGGVNYAERYWHLPASYNIGV
jgi:LmbE family N-acetylglucosaminyl deacetylase